MDIPQKPVLLTGASGVLGRVLVKALAAQGWPLRLTDGVAILRLAEGCGTIVHFGGISVEHPFGTVIGPNIRGLYYAYEAARREGARMVFASTNHVIGYYE